MRSRSCSALHSAVGGPPQAFRTSVWIAPWGRPLFPAAIATRVLSSLRSAGISSAAVAASPWAWQILRWGGVGYLLWLAWDGWRGAARTNRRNMLRADQALAGFSGAGW